MAARGKIISWNTTLSPPPWSDEDCDGYFPFCHTSFQRNVSDGRDICAYFVNGLQSNEFIMEFHCGRTPNDIFFCRITPFAFLTLYSSLLIRKSRKDIFKAASSY